LSTREHRHRLDRQRMHERIDFPVAEVPRVQENAAILGMRVHHALLAVEFHPSQHFVGAHRAELQQHDQQPPEMRERLAADRATFLLAPNGERRPQVLDRQSAVAAIDEVEGASEKGSGREHRPHRHHTDDRHDADHGEILEPVAERGPRAIRRRP
jgi:hypothetical protein